jgi:hypothetical protein
LVVPEKTTIRFKILRRTDFQPRMDTDPPIGTDLNHETYENFRFNRKSDASLPPSPVYGGTSRARRLWL